MKPGEILFNLNDQTGLHVLILGVSDRLCSTMLLQTPFKAQIHPPVLTLIVGKKYDWEEVGYQILETAFLESNFRQADVATEIDILLGAYSVQVAAVQSYIYYMQGGR